MKKTSQQNRNFEAMIRKEMDKLYRIGLGFCGNHTDAKDLVQETLLRAYQHWPAFEGRADPGTWLYRIATRACQRMRRRRAGEPAQMESLDKDPAFTERWMTDPEATSQHLDDDQEAALEKLRAAIATLPPKFRLPMVLKEIAGLSIEEAARALGLKPATMKTRLHRARMIVRQKMAKTLPQRSGTKTPYSRQVCLDLLRAKQDALDRGAAFPLPDGFFCERCRSVFASLDATLGLCHRIAGETSPAKLRQLIDHLAEKRGQSAHSNITFP